MPEFLSGVDPRVFYGVVITAAIIVWVANTVAERRRSQALKNRLRPSLLAKMDARPLPASISVLARAGENAAPRQSLDVTILTPTLGLRGIAVVIGGLLIWVIWRGMDNMSGSGFTVVPVGNSVKWAMTLVAAFCVLNTFLFEARIDRDRIVITKFGLWRREYQWRDFMMIKDDGNYLYFLHFAKGGKVSIPKHLVGMPGFLKVLGEIMERNDSANARAARG